MINLHRLFALLPSFVVARLHLPRKSWPVKAMLILAFAMHSLCFSPACAHQKVLLVLHGGPQARSFALSMAMGDFAGSVRTLQALRSA